MAAWLKSKASVTKAAQSKGGPNDDEE